MTTLPHHPMVRSNPRMQPTGRSGAELGSGGTLPDRGVERKLVRAPVWGLQLMRLSFGGAPQQRARSFHHVTGGER